MKSKLSLLLLFSVLAAIVTAQKINPTTQIKRPGDLVTPANPALNVADRILITNSGGFPIYQPATYLNGVLMDEVIESSGVPVAAPTSLQGGVYRNTATGIMYVWNGSAWVSINTTATNGATNYTSGGTGIGLGGTLNRNTTITGASTYTWENNDLSRYYVEADNGGGSARTALELLSQSNQGAFLSSRLPPYTEGTQLTVIPGTAHLSYQFGSGTQKKTRLMVDEGHAYVQAFKHNGNGVSLVVDTLGFELSGITAAGVSETEILYINPTTQRVFTGPIPSGSSGGDLSVESDNTLIVYQVATGTPVVSASRTGGTQTITATGGTIKLKSVATKGVTADLAGDNSFKIVCNGVFGTAQLAYPVIAKWNLSNMAPSDAVPHIQDVDNTPQVQVTAGTAGTSVTARVINLNAFTDWVIKMVW